ncbi:DMT family protein, partial [Klebsiella pneumoniae]|uniref:DMT family protein n=1 Tax=Klebsiella pneumoniae TaxID=573 RepID=UPI00117A262D
MFRALSAIGLLVVSNTFMTLAWYGQIAFKSKFEKLGLVAIILVSWLIALAEYSFMVPA